MLMLQCKSPFAGNREIHDQRETRSRENRSIQRHASSESMKPKPSRLLFFFFVTKPIPSIFPFSPPQRWFPFSTTSLTPNTPRLSHSFDDDVSGSSAVYRHALKFQRPATIEWRRELENRASFIGTVTHEPKITNTNNGNFGVHTMLKVRRSSEPNSSYFWVLLMMRHCMAEFASEHLKPNDFIYVSGCLGSYTKADATGNLLFKYKLYVKELDFVAQKLGYQGHKKLESNEAEVGIRNYRNRLYLWQVFFANPHEWWDQRKRKWNPRQPDFRHKDTGETLWLSQYDPPWVKKQLQLLDSKTAEGGHVGRRSRVATWVYDENL